MTADLIHASALAAHCPRCGAKPKKACRSVRGPRRGSEKRWCHGARIRAAA